MPTLHLIVFVIFLCILAFAFRSYDDANWQLFRERWQSTTILTAVIVVLNLLIRYLYADSIGRLRPPLQSYLLLYLSIYCPEIRSKAAVWLPDKLAQFSGIRLLLLVFAVFDFGVTLIILLT